ncbi:hypothetical protein QJQ45_025820 [Haematococcus lacustris]|nr:hypothetical protein QJQ45_025820 [Haematococcus lacustris]
MVNKKRGVKATCANLQKAREVMAERRAAEAEAKALALAAEAEAQALADAGAYKAQLHRLQTDLQLREQQLIDNQRLQTLQQHLQDLQRDELQRKEQQVAQQLAAVLQREQQLTEQQQQLQADLHLREQEVAEQQHQLQQQQADLHLREQQVAEQQQQADLHLREQQVAEQQHHLQQQHADMHLREQQVAEQRHMLQLQQQLNRLQQQLEARSGAELQRQVQQQLAEQQHLLQQQQADLQVKQQQVEEQLQEAADQQAVSTNHPLPDHPPCSPHVPESLRSPLIKRPRQDTTVAPMPRALRIPGLPYSAVVGAHQRLLLATAPPPPQPRPAQQAQSSPTQPLPSCLPPPPLHGGTATGLAVRAWGQSLTEYFQACRMPEDQWVPYAAGRLTGGAEVWWFHQVFNNTPAATCWMAFMGGLCEHYTPARESAWQPATLTSATRATAQRVHRAAPTVLLSTRNRFATLPVADEQVQQLPSHPARLDEHQAAAAAIAAAAVAAVLRAAAKAEAAGAAGGGEGHAQQGGGARAAGSGARSRDTAMRKARGNPIPAIPSRPVWDLRLHRQQQQQPQSLSTSPQAWQLRLQPLLDEFQKYPLEGGAELLDRLQQHRRMRSVVSLATGVVPPTPDQVLGAITVESLRPVLASTKPAPGGQRTTQQQPFNTALAMTMGKGIEQHGIKRTARQLGITPHAVKRARRSHLSNLAAGAAADWAAAPLRRCLSQEQLEYVRTFFEEHSSPSPMVGAKPSLACLQRQCAACKHRKVGVKAGCEGVQLQYRQFKKLDNGQGVELATVQTTLGELVAGFNALMQKQLWHQYLAKHQRTTFRAHCAAVHNTPGQVVVSCDWSEKLTIHQDIACQGAYWKQRTMPVFVACAHYQDMAGNYREESVFVSADKCDQSAEASTTALVQVIECLLQGRWHPDGILGVASNQDGVSERRDDGEGWVGKMDMRQLCLWSDGCASQFKGAKAIRLHWHLANKFGVPVQWSYGATSHFKSTHDSEGGVPKREWREQMLVHPELVGKVCGAVVLTDWTNKHFAVPCQDTSTSHRQRGHIMFRRYLVLDDARQAMVCSMPEADVERMHDKVEGCRAMHRMVFTPDREQPQWAMAGCACSMCMSVPCLPCMKPDTTTPLEPMPMFQDTVKEVREDKECYALLMWFHPNLMHNEVCFGKLTNTHCARYRMHMGWKREETRRELRRLVLRELRSEELEFEYEANG